VFQAADELRRAAKPRRLAWLAGALLGASCARFGYELEGEAGQLPGVQLDQLDAGAAGQGGMAQAASGAGGAAGASGATAGSGSGGSVPFGGSGGASGGASGASAGFVPPSCNRWGTFAPAELVTGLGPDVYVKPAPSADGSLLLLAHSNNGQAEILSATRDGRGPAFSPATRLPNVNTSDASARGTPFLSADSLTLFYYSNQAGGVGNRDLYATSRASVGEEFFPGSIVPNVNSPGVDHMPSLTADELTLAFISQRDQGNNDIWLAERSARSAAFGAPRSLAVNTAGNEESPALSADGLELVFASDRAGGRGGLDLWRSTRARRQDEFSSPVNLSELNTTDDEHEVALSADGVELFFVVDGAATSSVRLVHSLRSCLD
jgi:hypothetical protein